MRSMVEGARARTPAWVEMNFGRKGAGAGRTHPVLPAPPRCARSPSPAEAGEDQEWRRDVRAPTLTFKRARALRREMTLPEVVLWRALRRGDVAELRFRRQHPLGPYVLDFYCAEARLPSRSTGRCTT